MAIVGVSKAANAQKAYSNARAKSKVAGVPSYGTFTVGPASTPRSAPPTTGGYSGGGGYGGGGDYSPAPVVAPPSEEDYLAGDSAYQTQLAALKGALERYISDSGLQKANYQTDYRTSLRDLGYNENPTGAGGNWNWEDMTTASGKAYQNQLNDFASRGLLQSQGYADSVNDLQKMLNQQYGQLSTNKNNFMSDLERQIANYTAENTSGSQAARGEAIARRAAQYGL